MEERVLKSEMAKLLKGKMRKSEVEREEDRGKYIGKFCKIDKNLYYRGDDRSDIINS